MAWKHLYYLLTGVPQGHQANALCDRKPMPYDSAPESESLIHRYTVQRLGLAKVGHQRFAASKYFRCLDHILLHPLTSGSNLYHYGEKSA